MPSAGKYDKLEPLLLTPIFAMNSALRARLEHAKKRTKTAKRIKNKTKKRQLKGQI